MTVFKRYAKVAADELETGVLGVERTEIVRLDNDPNFPERGLLRLRMGAASERARPRHLRMLRPAADRAQIDNRPALSAIGYRIGTYGTFRAEMLAEVSSPPELRAWTARSSEDYGIALLEMWAYIADILTFYQERVANEAFLRTAQSPESLVQLARMLDYRPAPGVSAMAELAFRLDPDKQVELPAHLRVQSVPATRRRSRRSSRPPRP